MIGPIDQFFNYYCYYQIEKRNTHITAKHSNEVAAKVIINVTNR